MKKIFVVVFVVILIITSIILINHISYKMQRSPENHIDGSITIDGIKRTYHLYIPTIYDGKKDVPLLIVLHGRGGTGKGIEEKTTLEGFDKLAEKDNFIVVYPDGFNKRWSCHVRGNVDDVKFISKLIDYLEDEYKIDKNRIYVTGMSNGGVMTFCLACNLDKISAIATVAASMPEKLYENCSPQKHIPVLIIQGTDDPIVPWNGGDVIIFGKYVGRVVSINKTVEFWATYNNCTFQSKEYLPDLDPNDGTRVWVERYANKENNIEVVLYGIEGGGHTWPDGGRSFPESVTGKMTHDINACEVIWDFFERGVK